MLPPPSPSSPKGSDPKDSADGAPPPAKVLYFSVHFDYLPLTPHRSSEVPAVVLVLVILVALVLVVVVIRHQVSNVSLLVHLYSHQACHLRCSKAPTLSWRSFVYAVSALCSAVLTTLCMQGGNLGQLWKVQCAHSGTEHVIKQVRYEEGAANELRAMLAVRDVPHCIRLTDVIATPADIRFVLPVLQQLRVDSLDVVHQLAYDGLKVLSPTLCQLCLICL